MIRSLGLQLAGPGSSVPLVSRIDPALAPERSVSLSTKLI